MKKHRAILFLGIFAIVGIAVVLNLPEEPVILEPSKPENAVLPSKSNLRREVEFRMGLPGSTNPLALKPPTFAGRNIPIEEEKSFTQILAERIDADSLEKYQGSYTKDEFQDREDAQGITLNTRWIWGDSAPSAGLRVVRDAESGEYEVRGGEFYLPNSGVGMSYERDGESGENKTYINLKRNF